jgi:hypothetical protein
MRFTECLNDTTKNRGVLAFAVDPGPKRLRKGSVTILDRAVSLGCRLSLVAAFAATGFERAQNSLGARRRVRRPLDVEWLPSRS